MVVQNIKTKSYLLFISTPKAPFELESNSLSNFSMELIKTFQGINYDIASKLHGELCSKPTEGQIDSLEVLLLKPKKTKLAFNFN